MRVALCEAILFPAGRRSVASLGGLVVLPQTDVFQTRDARFLHGEDTLFPLFSLFLSVFPCLHSSPKAWSFDQTFRVLVTIIANAPFPRRLRPEVPRA